MALTDPHPPFPTARALRDMRRRFTRIHAPTTDRTGTIVLTALGVYVVTGIGWWLATRPSGALVKSIAARYSETASWNTGWAWVASAAAFVAGSAAARALGPLTTSPERSFWLLSTPVDRAAMLRPGILVASTAAAGIGAVAGRLASFAGAVEYWAPLTVFGVVIGVGMASIAVLTQCKVLPAQTVGALQIVVAAGGGGIAAVTYAGIAIPVFTTWAPVVAASVPTIAIMIAALAACGRITTADLHRGAEIAGAARTSLIGLDLTILTEVADERAWLRITRRPSRALPPGRTHALIRTDLLRHRRRPSAFVATVVAVGCAWTVGALTSPTVAAWIQLAAVAVAALVFSTGLRDLASRPELRALLGGADRDLYRPLMVLPVGAALMVTATTAVLTAWSLPVSALIATGACVAVHRLRTRPRTTYDGLVLETGFGQLPLDLIRQWLRGPDVLLVTAMLVALLV